MGSDHASVSAGPYKTFGWQGINLTVPSGWDLVFTQGDYRAGHVRLADADSVRLEVRWQTGQPAQSPAAVIDAYLAKLKKKSAKEGGEFSVQRNLGLASPAEKEVECYRWVADQQALAMLSRCRKCNRLVHLHLLGRPEEQLKRLARTVFASLADHPEHDTLLWEFFDMEFETPTELSLTGKSLQSGCISVVFSRRLTRLEFVRVSLAQILLAGKGLTEWFRQFYAKSLRRRSFRLRELQVKGHPGLEVRGRAWLLVNPLSLLGRARVVQGACWHCEDTNRLFICCFDGLEKAAAAFPNALDSFKCCQKA